MKDLFTVTSSSWTTESTPFCSVVHFSFFFFTLVLPRCSAPAHPPHPLLLPAISVSPFLCQEKNVAHCKVYSLYNTRQGWISEADFVFELLWQLVEDRLTAHPLHNGGTGPVVQTPVPILPLSICHSSGTLCVCWTIN